MSVRLYVKLPKAPLEKEGVEKMFGDFEDSFTTKLIRERKKRECRGFGFVTVNTDEAAEAFISKYNEQPFVYEGETFKDEDGKEFILTIEKALPRTKNQEEESTEESKSELPSKSPVKVKELPNTEAKSSKPPRPKKSNKNRVGSKPKANKGVSVSDAIQPDPRWADELNQLKQKFASQVSN